MPHHHMVIPHYMGKSRDIGFEANKSEEDPNDIDRKNSFSSLSPSQDDIPLLLPQESDLIDSDPNLLNGTHDGKSHIDHPNVVPRGNSQEFETLIPEKNVTTSYDEWWENLEARNKNVLAADDFGQVGPRSTCRCQVSKAINSVIFSAKLIGMRFCTLFFFCRI